MRRLYDGLSVVSLTEDQHRKTCGYWWCVESHCTAHTAFRTRAGLDRWLEERGLKLEKELPAKGEWAWSGIIGSYADQAHMDPKDFWAPDAILETKTLSNGDYVVARIAVEPDGIRCVHTLNPNVRHRKVYPYFEAEKEMA